MAVLDVKIDVRTSVLKPKSAHWLIAVQDTLSQKPEIVINGFKRQEFLMHSEVINTLNCSMCICVFCMGTSCILMLSHIKSAYVIINHLTQTLITTNISNYMVSLAVADVFCC